MAEDDKSRRDQRGTPFRYESTASPDVVVQALMRLDRPYWFMVTGDIRLEEGAAGYAFRFRQLIARLMTSEIDVHLWESPEGTTIIEGVFRKRRWPLTVLFLTTLIFGSLATLSFAVSLSAPSSGAAHPFFGFIGALNLASLCATFFYALRYDTAYHVEKVLQQFQGQHSQAGTVKSYPHLQDADHTPESLESRTLSDYEDDQAYGHKR